MTLNALEPVIVNKFSIPLDPDIHAPSLIYRFERKPGISNTQLPRLCHVGSLNGT